ncbi:MAG: AAA family ATPase [Deltaproteobacteria bacterium]|nr:AAA family ATPase [Deltaproteobacteria bacterium]
MPTGIQTFKDLTLGNNVYAGKTRYVYEMARKGRAYLLSRPKGFGKSLLLSTFEALFSGPHNPDGPPLCLFSELWMSQHSDYDFTQKYPVLTSSMASGARQVTGTTQTISCDSIGRY